MWHSAQLLEPLAPKRVRKLKRRAHRVSDLLGDDHDLVVLLERAEQMPDAFGAGELELLSTLAERQRRELERKALARAGKLYRRKPRKLARRLRVA